jgi:ApaG protein
MTDKTKIYSAISNNISISVVPRYIPEESNPAIGKFIYSYEITIQNLGDSTVQLISRHWHIRDSIQVKREVKGEGVVGKQPILLPGESFSYMSWCPLDSPIGKMSGTFTFIHTDTEDSFEAEIPEFLLISDFKLN